MKIPVLESLFNKVVGLRLSTLLKKDSDRCLRNFKNISFKEHALWLLLACYVNHLSANFKKWSNTLKQFVGKWPTNCLSVFDHFVGLALKVLNILEVKELPWLDFQNKIFTFTFSINQTETSLNQNAFVKFNAFWVGYFLPRNSF